MQLSDAERKNDQFRGIDNYFLSKVAHSFLGKWNAEQLRYVHQIRSYLMAQLLLKAHENFPEKLIVGITGAAHVLDAVILQVFVGQKIQASFLLR